MMSPMAVGGATKVGLLLLTLAAGYGVLVLANKQERPLDVLGRLIGGLILIVSLGGLLCIAVCAMGCRKGSCHKMSAEQCDPGMKKMCPFSTGNDQPSEPVAVPQQNPQ